MKRIYTLREAKEDIVKAKTRIKWILDEIQEWDVEDKRAFSPQYLRMLLSELKDLEDSLLVEKSDNAIAHRAAVIYDTLVNYISDYLREEIENNEKSNTNIK